MQRFASNAIESTVPPRQKEPDSKKCRCASINLHYRFANSLGEPSKPRRMVMAFGPQSTTDEVLEGVDLSGTRIVVTGVSAGLGVGTARDLAKARTATKPVLAAASNGGGLELVTLDLGTLASVRTAADAIVAQGKKLDAIIANAGVMACPQGKTTDGFETQFGTNHLGHFVFVNRLV